MKRSFTWQKRWLVLFCLALLTVVSLSRPGHGMIPSLAHGFSSSSQTIASAEEASPASNQDAAPEESSTDTDLQPFTEAIVDREVRDGLFTLYYEPEERSVYAEIKPEQLKQTYLLQSSLSRGLGEFGLYRGMPLQDLPITLRRIRNTLEVVVPNASIRSRAGDITETYRDQFFSDSIVLSLPILSIRDESKSFLVDLEPFFALTSPAFQDLSNWVGFLGYGASSNRLETAQAFPLNLEFEAIYQFNGAPGEDFFAPISIPNPSSFNLGVHYSFSEITPNPTYRPRLADERVGYFLTAYWDLSKRRDRDPFVRYINRWDLQKQDPSADLSPPVKPIVFWLENTIPPEYREAVRQGVLLWNTVFEQIGLKDAIVVEQMPDDADWDPADIRYNTIRWTTSLDGGFALGPSRVNPYTGQILDADILVDENYVRFSVDQFRKLGENPLGGSFPWSRLTRDPRICDAQLGMALLKDPDLRQKLPSLGQNNAFLDRCYSQESQQLLALGTLALTLNEGVLPSSDTMKRFLEQAIQDVIAHEVGHTLGLRHNFHGSTHLSPAALQDDREEELSSSIMDYLPPNLAAPNQAQGNFFPLALGEYDQWAIEYGYTPFDPNLSLAAERQQLKTIADRSINLDYGTDEDAFTDLDPDIALFDLSNDSLTYNSGQMDLAQSLWQKLDQRYPVEGESYSEGRAAFSRVFFHYFSNAYQLTRYVAGRSVTRYLGGDTVDQYPLEPIDVARQRKALDLLGDRIFRAEAFDFPPNLIRKLTPARWFHWAALPFFDQVEYPLADRVLTFQTLILADLFSPPRLERLRDTTLQYPGVEPLTVPELFATVQDAIWDRYLTFDSTQTEIPLLQRRLQQQYLNLLINLTQEGFAAVDNAVSFSEFLLAIYTIGSPREAKILAHYYLEDLSNAVAKAIKKDDHLDLESQLHLTTTYDRIQRILNPQT